MRSKGCEKKDAVPPLIDNELRVSLKVLTRTYLT